MANFSGNLTEQVYRFSPETCRSKYWEKLLIALGSRIVQMFDNFSPIVVKFARKLHAIYTNMKHDSTKTHNNVKGFMEDECQNLCFRLLMQTEDGRTPEEEN